MKKRVFLTLTTFAFMLACGAALPKKAPVYVATMVIA
jgi:hypothetical protein